VSNASLASETLWYQLSIHHHPLHTSQGTVAEKGQTFYHFEK
jgi:hypothetical protein